jgi:hypothetical protein
MREAAARDAFHLLPVGVQDSGCSPRTATSRPIKRLQRLESKLQSARFE